MFTIKQSYLARFRIMSSFKLSKLVVAIPRSPFAVLGMEYIYYFVMSRLKNLYLISVDLKCISQVFCTNEDIRELSSQKTVRDVTKLLLTNGVQQTVAGSFLAVSIVTSY